MRTWIPSVVAISVLSAAVLAAGSYNSGHSSGLGGEKTPVPNPDAGLTDSERDARYKASWDSFNVRFAAWVAALKLAPAEIAKLPHADIQSLVVPPKPTLAESVAAAEAAVVGSVVDVRPDGFGSIAQVRVERTLKGQFAASLITVASDSGFRPTADWTGAQIADSPTGPLLIPGQRVVLFLVSSQGRGADFGTESVTGQYVILPKGGIQAAPLNPFGAQVAGLSEAGLLAAVASAH